jgi:hypothetical protein
MTTQDPVEQKSNDTSIVDELDTIVRQAEDDTESIETDVPVD